MPLRRLQTKSADVFLNLIDWPSQMTGPRLHPTAPKILPSPLLSEPSAIAHFCMQRKVPRAAFPSPTAASVRLDCPCYRRQWQ